MSADDFANWTFAWIMTGSVIWALMYRPAEDGSFRRAAVTASIGMIIGWPIALVLIAQRASRAWRR